MADSSIRLFKEPPIFVAGEQGEQGEQGAGELTERLLPALRSQLMPEVLGASRAIVQDIY